MPMAAFSSPTVESLRCRSSSAVTTTRTPRRACEHRLRRVEQDDDAEPPVAADRPKAAGCLTQETAAVPLDLPLLALAGVGRADQRDEPRSPDEGRRLTSITVPGLQNASSAPPIAGPAKVPTLSIVLRTTFAAVSSSGVRASGGAGRTRPGGTRCRGSRPARRAHTRATPIRRRGRPRPRSPIAAPRPEVRDRQERHAREAVGQRRREGRGDRRGDRPRRA